MRDNNGLFAEFAETKRLVQTSERKRVGHKGFSILKVRIVRAVSDNNVVAGKVNRVMFDDIIPSVNRNLGIKFEGTELKKQGNPVEDCMIAAQQVQHF